MQQAECAGNAICSLQVQPIYHIHEIKKFQKYIFIPNFIDPKSGRFLMDPTAVADGLYRTRKNDIELYFPHPS
jgi:hypothetical protein